LPLLVGEKSPATLNPLPAPAMASEHPDAPKQFGIRLSNEVMAMIGKIQEYRKKQNHPTTLSSIVEDAIEEMYDFMVENGVIEGEEE
jgi:predicted DNA-binding protein